MSEEITVEQQCRDILERMGIEDAQEFSSGDLVEMANLISKANTVKESRVVTFSELKPGQRFVIRGIRTPLGFVTVHNDITHYDAIDSAILVLIEE